MTSTLRDAPADWTDEPADVPTGDVLVGALYHLGIRHLSRGRMDRTAGLPAETLLVGLATSPEARLRAALVPLFLWSPEHAKSAQAATKRLSGHARATLECSYTAAVALRTRHARRLARLTGDGQPLPDLFGSALGLPPSEDVDARLIAVPKRHEELSGEAINWLGTYQHAVAALLRANEPAPQWNP